MKEKTKHTDADEIALLHRAILGDGKAMSELYRLSWPPLVKSLTKNYIRKRINVSHVAYRISSPHDLAQVAFLKLFKIPKDKALEIRNLQNYLFITAINILTREIETLNRTDMSIAIYTRHNHSVIYEIGESLEYEDSHQNRVYLIRSALQSLSRRQREAWEMFHVYGISQSRIAELTGVNTGTIKKHVYDATLAIRTYLKKHLATT